MQITRNSIWSNITRTRDIDVTEEQLRRIANGENIQYVLPHLTDGDREFILSGCTDEEWDEMFLEEDEDE